MTNYNDLAIQAEIEKNSISSSNLTKYVESALKLISNLHNIWELSDYTAKQKFQKLLFPNGITYHRQNDQVQTSKVNSILELIQTISRSFNQKENGQPVSNTQLSALVTPNIQSSNFLIQDLEEIEAFMEQCSIE